MLIFTLRGEKEVMPGSFIVLPSNFANASSKVERGKKEECISCALLLPCNLKIPIANCVLGFWMTLDAYITVVQDCQKDC